MISTHILDTHLGKPAADVEVKLMDATGQVLATASTNNDGRVLVPDFGLDIPVTTASSLRPKPILMPKAWLPFFQRL